MTAVPTTPARSRFDPADGVVAVNGVTKMFGSLKAVDDLTFAVTPGRVTGFLGPNGAGKTTTLRLLLGLATPNAGSVTIGGIRYGQRPRPAHHVGAALEAASFHPGRSARNHLRVYAPEVGVPDLPLRRGARDGGPDRSGRPARGWPLHGDAPAPGPGRDSARRPPGPAAG